jgi:3-isopropylmalate/(R)-2-methylmalate dehydratase large subunit
MGKTIIQKIFETHSNTTATIDEIIDVTIDVRVARDFGGANVVKHLEEYRLPIYDSKQTFFTFDCNPGGCDQKYAENQQICRVFARKHGIKIYDINSGIGTHLAFEEGLVFPLSQLIHMPISLVLLVPLVKEWEILTSLMRLHMEKSGSKSPQHRE